jgi:hypothetical protein
MVHVENTGQVKLTQELGKWISRYSADERFTRYLEIGTWNGQGSTCCFYDGFARRSSPYTLQSYEISAERVEQARGVWKDVPDIRILHGRVLQDHECPVFDKVKELFPTMTVAWHAEDIRNFWSCPYVPMESPEVVLLDGAEYLTQFEFEAIKSLDSTRVFLLDDVYTDKCPRVFEELSTNPDWACVAKGTERNGWAVFEKTAKNPKVEMYRQLIKTAHQSAERGQSKLPPEILAMSGMSGLKTRHFYNHMLTLDDSRYLEIGPWMGSSVCSAMYGNAGNVVVIDNWSEFGGPKEEFLRNFNTWKGANNASFIEGDCFKVDVSTLPKFNIYMYDGNHDEESHFKALTHYYDAMDDIFIFIVDDWHCKHIRDGTFRAINALDLYILDSIDIRLNFDNIQTGYPDSWWNGMYVAILQKRDQTATIRHT